MDKETGKGRETSYKKRSAAIRWGWAALLSFAGVCALPYAVKAGGNVLGFTNSIFAFFLFLGLSMCFHKVLEVSFSGGRKKWI